MFLSHGSYARKPFPPSEALQHQDVGFLDGSPQPEQLDRESLEHTRDDTFADHLHRTPSPGAEQRFMYGIRIGVGKPLGELGTRASEADVIKALNDQRSNDGKVPFGEFESRVYAALALARPIDATQPQIAESLEHSLPRSTLSKNRTQSDASLGPQTHFHPGYLRRGLKRPLSPTPTLQTNDHTTLLADHKRQQIDVPSTQLSGRQTDDELISSFLRDDSDIESPTREMSERTGTDLDLTSFDQPTDNSSTAKQYPYYWNQEQLQILKDTYMSGHMRLSQRQWVKAATSSQEAAGRSEVPDAHAMPGLNVDDSDIAAGRTIPDNLTAPCLGFVHVDVLGFPSVEAEKAHHPFTDDTSRLVASATEKPIPSPSDFTNTHIFDLPSLSEKEQDQRVLDILDDPTASWSDFAEVAIPEFHAYEALHHGAPEGYNASRLDSDRANGSGLHSLSTEELISSQLNFTDANMLDLPSPLHLNEAHTLEFYSANAEEKDQFFLGAPGNSTASWLDFAHGDIP